MTNFYGLFDPNAPLPPREPAPEPPPANSEVARQRARVDALIAWVINALDELNEHVAGPLGPSDLEFPDPYPTAESAEYQRKVREERERKRAEQEESDRRRARAIVNLLSD